MFTTEEINYIANAINEMVKQTGLQNAAMALTIIAKLQADKTVEGKADVSNG